MDLTEFFLKLEAIEPIYEVEGYYGESFMTFMYRFQSLHRYWEINRSLINSHISTLKDLKNSIKDVEIEDVYDNWISDGEIELIYSEIAYPDIEYFPEYIRASTLTFALSLVENLLLNLSEEVARDLGVKVNLVKRREIPYITKYILWLTQGCGIDINIDEEVENNLDVIRNLRNRFIHKISKDIPETVKTALRKMVSDIAVDEKLISDEFVNEVLQNISKYVKTIELAYIDYCENSLNKTSS